MFRSSGTIGDKEYDIPIDGFLLAAWIALEASTSPVRAKAEAPCG